jgi:dTDP-4-amino-4,6-dideoxygalactose transaminase
VKIPFLSFEETNRKIKSEILTSFEEFFDKSWYILGDSVKKFEKEYATFNNVEYAIGISNGLDALHVALKTLDIGSGDEVIIPSNTFIASALAVSYTGAKPVLVEPDRKTYNIDPGKIESAITFKTKAIMPVHLYGQACEMDAIMAIAQKHNLYIVEDNAQSQGATFNGRMTGSFGDINGTSFYPGKNLGALGDAGALTTNNSKLAQKANAFRNYGSTKKYYNEVIGFNMRLDECRAAFLSIKLQYLKNWTEERKQIAAWYDEALCGNQELILPPTAKNATHAYHLYVIRTKRRNELQKHLSSNGIGTLIHYPVPIHLQEAYRNLDYKKGDFPIAEEIANSCLSLPMWPGITKSMVEEVAQIINKFK